MEWTRGATIGHGSTATVSLATTSTGDIFAVKSTDLSRSTYLQREQQLLSHLSSVHVIEYKGFDVTYENNKPMYNLFMEYAPGGSVSDVIKKQGGSLNEPTIQSFTSQILQGLDYLHLNNLVHCDIKGQNILIGEDGIKIGDFGCAKLVEHGSGAAATASVFSGTPVFMAPEVARGEEQGFPADIWALGCTIIEMATGSNIWPEMNNPVSALYRIGYSDDLPEFPKWLSDEAKDFLGKCLNRNSTERWTVKELLQHSFIDNLDSNFEKTEVFSRKSPTSMLDHGFWDLLDMSETCRNPTNFVDSPVERIKQLIGASPKLPNWADYNDDDSWVTIRSNQVEEVSRNSEWDNEMDSDNNSTLTGESLELSLVVEEESESLISRNEALLRYNSSEISSERSNIRTDFYVLLCETVDDNVVFLDFDDKINGKHILFSQVFFQLKLLYVSNWLMITLRVMKAILLINPILRLKNYFKNLNLILRIEKPTPDIEQEFYFLSFV